MTSSRLLKALADQHRCWMATRPKLLVSIDQVVSTQRHSPPLDTLREAVLDQLEGGVGACLLPQSL